MSSNIVNSIEGESLMSLDIQKLINSDFYIKNSVFYNKETKKHIHISNRNRIVFDTTVVTSKTLDIIKDFENKDSAIAHASLISNIHFSTLDNLWKQEILEQWKEILSITKQIKIDSMYSFLIIALPGCQIETHQHTDISKQTLTFRYIHKDCKKSENTPYIKLFNNDKILHLNDSFLPKSYFTFTDDKPHNASINELSFFWSFDYPDYLDLSNVDFGPFKKYEFLES